MPSQVIVNADDFGLNEHTNAVILRAFQCGLISSATAMASMPAFKAACALANKLARICYATLRDKTPFGDTERLNRKITRESFVMPA